jgi:hypothetical protein
VTAEPFSFTAWSPGEPNNAGDGECYVHYWRWSSLGWNGTSACSSRSFVVEWDADCNHDGIVDYGQCHDGTLPDYNGNNIPDCCERGEACVVGNYPVQWRVDDGGNGHWYRMVTTTADWQTAMRAAVAAGGHGATVSSMPENAFTFGLTRPGTLAHGVWLGGSAPTNSCADSASYRWANGEAMSWMNWYPGEPNGGFGSNECAIAYSFWTPEWNDMPQSWSGGLLIEWDEDCNHDTIVDYGQILLGQLDDTNANGIPDICEVPTCRDVDLFRNGVINGADLGILLSEWGPASANTVSDINRDGRVDGSDLGTLLAFWGPCGG